MLKNKDKNKKRHGFTKESVSFPPIILGAYSALFFVKQLDELVVVGLELVVFVGNLQGREHGDFRAVEAADAAGHLLHQAVDALGEFLEALGVVRRWAGFFAAAVFAVFAVLPDAFASAMEIPPLH